MSIKDLAEVLGYEIKDEKDFKIEDFKAHVDNIYVTRKNAVKDDDIIQAVQGSFLAPIQRHVAKQFGLEKADYEGKKFNEIIDVVKGKVDLQVKELTEKAGKGDDAKVLDLQKELDKEKIRARDLETALTTKETEWTGKVNELTGTIKNTKLNEKISKAKEKINFIDDFKANAILQKGFDAAINDKYKIDLNEKDEVIIVDAKEGKPILNPKKSGHFLSYEEVIAMEAETANLIKKNNAPPKGTPAKKILSDGTEKPAVNKVHPNALKREAELNGR